MKRNLKSDSLLNWNLLLQCQCVKNNQCVNKKICKTTEIKIMTRDISNFQEKRFGKIVFIKNLSLWNFSYLNKGIIPVSGSYWRFSDFTMKSLFYTNAYAMQTKIRKYLNNFWSDKSRVSKQASTFDYALTIETDFSVPSTKFGSYWHYLWNYKSEEKSIAKL